MSREKHNIKQQAIDWNNKYPLDRWYRDKYSIPFNSQQHQDLRVVDIRFQYEEDVIYGELRHTKSEKGDIPYSPGSGNWLSPREQEIAMSKDEVDNLFDTVDITDL